MLDYITVFGFIIFLVLLILVACRLVMDFPGIVEGDISQVLSEYGISKEEPVEEVVHTERRQTESSDCKQNKSLMTKMSNKPNIHKIHGSEDIKVKIVIKNQEHVTINIEVCSNDCHSKNAESLKYVDEPYKVACEDPAIENEALMNKNVTNTKLRINQRGRADV